MSRFWLMISSWSMVNWCMVCYCMVNRSRMVDKCCWVVNRSSMVNRFRLVIRFWLIIGFWLIIRFWLMIGLWLMVGRGCVVDRFNWAISWGGGVTIHWGISFSISFSQNCCHCYRDKNLKS